MFGRARIGVAKKPEQAEREQHADAEEDRQRFVAAVAGLHQAQAQRPHLLGRARHLVADPLEDADQRLALAASRVRRSRARDVSSSSRRSIATCAPRHEQQARRRQSGRCRTRRPEVEAARYTSILTICLIQRYPHVCMTTAAISIMLADALAEQQVHVLWIDEQQRDRRGTPAAPAARSRSAGRAPCRRAPGAGS